MWMRNRVGRPPGSGCPIYRDHVTFLMARITPAASKSSTSLAKSVRDRVGRSTLYTTTTSMSPERMEEALQRQPVARPAREVAIVEARPDQAPALMGLAFDVGLRGLTLCVEGVEVLLRTVLGRDPRVDRAPQRLRGWARQSALQAFGP